MHLQVVDLFLQVVDLFLKDTSSVGPAVDVLWSRCAKFAAAEAVAANTFAGCSMFLSTWKLKKSNQKFISTKCLTTLPYSLPSQKNTNNSKTLSKLYMKDTILATILRICS